MSIKLVVSATGTKDGATNAKILKWLEYGVPINNVPARLLVHKVVQQLFYGKGNLKNIAGDVEIKGQKIPAIIQSLIIQVINQPSKAEALKLEAANKIGALVVKGLQNAILNNKDASFIAPKNADSVVKSKGFDHPYYETGDLVKNIYYRIDT